MTPAEKASKELAERMEAKVLGLASALETRAVDLAEKLEVRLIQRLDNLDIRIRTTENWHSIAAEKWQANDKWREAISKTVEGQQISLMKLTGALALAAFIGSLAVKLLPSFH